MTALTVEALAQAKRLPVEYLHENGLENLPGGIGVAIPYFDENRQKHARTRKRTALRAKDGSTWDGPPTTSPIAYGIWRLAEAREQGWLILVEGESDCWTLWYHGYPVLGIPGATMSKTLEASHLAGIGQILVCREPDQGGVRFVTQTIERLSELHFRGEAYEFSIKGFKDPSDLHCDDPARIRERFERALNHTTVLTHKADSTDREQIWREMKTATLRVFNIRDLLTLELPPREFVLEPILRERDGMMVFSWRGVGKTMLGLYMAYAIASGAACLRWKAPKPRRVLYIDGELPLQSLQDRLAPLIEVQEAEPPDPEYLRFLTHDAQEFGLPDLATRAGQDALRPYIEPAEVIFFDSLSTLVRGAKENDAEGWQLMQDFLLELRRCGKTSAIVHHEGKSGTQRGTSKREDILDAVIHLRQPAGYRPEQGARFEVHFEKCRALMGKAAEPFEARLEAINDAVCWTTHNIEDANLIRAKELFEIGMSIREVADELRIGKSTAHRLKKQLDEMSQRPTA